MSTRSQLFHRGPGVTLPTRDVLNSLSREDVARVAFKGIDLIEREKPEAQVHAAALMFLAISARIGIDAREALERSERILNARYEDYDRRANAHFTALVDYIDHLHDPVKSRGIRQGDATL